MRSRSRVLLLQPPIASHNSASLALPRIKASLATEGYPCEIRYLDHELEASVGVDAIQQLAFRSAYWLVELLYAAELFPRYLDTEALLARHRALVEHEPALASYPDPRELLRVVRRFNQGVVGGWRTSFPYDAVGITCNFYIMPALYFASAIKGLHPGVRTILGGMQAGGEVGDALIKAFPFIDWVVKGEGELTILKIMRLLRRTVDEVPPGAAHRDGSRVLCDPRPEAPIRLDELPVPDFDDFVASYERHSFREPIHLALETSRGCWWSRCGFCGFNSLGMKYRSLSPERVVEDLEHLARRHGVLSYQFVDNIASPRLDRLAKAIAASPYEFRWMISLRADTPPSTVELCAEAGATELFFGIESYSTSVLERMGKGTTLLDNLVALKEARRVGVAAPYFILTQFPGETGADVERNREIHELIPHLNALSLDSPFYVHYGCPTHREPRRFGLERVSPHPFYAWLLPEECRFAPTYFWECAPRAPRQPVIDPGGPSRSDDPRLELVDKGPSSSFVVDARWSMREAALTERERHVLLHCDEPRTREELREHAAEVTELMHRGWLVEDRERLLSLTIRRTR